MAKSDFKMNPNFEQEILRSTGVRVMLEGVTRAVTHRAKQLVSKGATKKLHDSIEGEVGIERRGYIGRVNAHDFKANWFEYGTEKMRARPFLRPAAEQIVGHIQEGRRR